MLRYYLWKSKIWHSSRNSLGIRITWTKMIIQNQCVSFLYMKISDSQLERINLQPCCVMNWTNAKYGKMGAVISIMLHFCKCQVWSASLSHWLPLCHTHRVKHLNVWSAGALQSSDKSLGSSHWEQTVSVLCTHTKSHNTNIGQKSKCNCVPENKSGTTVWTYK